MPAMSTVPESVDSSAMCAANIGAAGRRRRLRVGTVVAVLCLGLLGYFIGVRAPWYMRLALFLPAAGAGIALLQVSRKTCVAMARMGVVENEDFSYTKVNDALAAASRRVAATIFRDGILIGVAAAGVGALTSLVR